MNRGRAKIVQKKAENYIKNTKYYREKEKEKENKIN